MKELERSGVINSLSPKAWSKSELKSYYMEGSNHHPEMEVVVEGSRDTRRSWPKVHRTLSEKGEH